MAIFIAGTPLLSALNGVFWILTLVWFTSQSPIVAGLFPPGIYHLGLMCMVVGNLVVMYMSLYVARVMERPDLLVAALLSPGYWLLAGVAAIKAVVQLIRNPSYWEKTAHGLHAKAGPSPVDGQPAHATPEPGGVR